MLIFVSGHFPILGTQMLYFTDPVLLKRAALRPATRFFSLENGSPVPQKPFDRGPNVISQAEDDTDIAELEEGLSPIIQGFIEELHSSEVQKNAEESN